jgi:hypothetical protein
MEMPWLRRQTRLVALFVKAAALGMFGFYLLWNVYWLGQGRLPDSILKAFIGIPCPTTGCTRSIAALVHGEWLQSFLWNPIALIYISLFMGSAGLLAHQALKGKRLALPPAVVLLWAGSLAVGWILKLIIGPEYW